MGKVAFISEGYISIYVTVLHPDVAVMVVVVTSTDKTVRRVHKHLPNGKCFIQICYLIRDQLMCFMV